MFCTFSPKVEQVSPLLTHCVMFDYQPDVKLYFLFYHTLNTKLHLEALLKLDKAYITNYPHPITPDQSRRQINIIADLKQALQCLLSKAEVAWVHHNKSAL